MPLVDAAGGSETRANPDSTGLRRGRPDAGLKGTHPRARERSSGAAPAEGSGAGSEDAAGPSAGAAPEGAQLRVCVRRKVVYRGL